MTQEEKKKIDGIIFDERKVIPREVLDKHLRLSAQEDDDLLELFLAMGADPNTVFRQMAKAGKLEAVKLLYEYGAYMDTDLTEVIQNDQVEVVDYMLEKGARVSEYDISYAKQNNSSEMMFVILKHCVKDGKYVEQTFESDTCEHWGQIRNLTTKVLAVILKEYEENPQKFSNILNSKRPQSEEYFFMKQLERSLNYGIEVADFERIKLIIEFFERRDWYSPSYYSWDVSKLYKNIDSVETLKKIIEFFNEHGSYIGEGRMYQLKTNSSLYTKATIEILNMLNIMINMESLNNAIKCSNEKLVKQLIQYGILPGKKQVEEAYCKLMRCKDSKQKKVCRRIYEFVVENQK